MKGIAWKLLSATTLGIATALGAGCGPSAPLGAGPRTDQAQVRKMIQSNAFILDVRTPGEFAGARYPGAVNIPVQELQARMAEIPKGRPIVAYCASGARSEHARRLLLAAGFPEVVNAGGLGSMPW